MVYSFYFLLVGSRRNECNSLWEELRGRSQKSTATHKVCLPAFLLALTLYLQWSILFIFCVLAPEGMNEIVFGEGEGGEVRSLLLVRKISLSWNFIYLFSHSFWSQNTEKRNTALSQMRLGSVFKMRMSILNTATTEQMG